ncbi:MAG: sporulation protein YunB [Clostridiales bacterium]|nr:sporulation protein YunB [Clostridiales bacterium]
MMGRFFGGRWKRILLSRIVILFVFFALACVYSRAMIKPLVCEIAESTCTNAVTRAINESVYEVLHTEDENGIYLSQLLQNQSNISSVSLNCAEFNMIKSKIVLSAQEKLNKMNSIIINIPLGTFTGLETLKSKGPAITIKSDLSSSITADFSSSLENTGKCAVYTITADFKVNTNMVAIYRFGTEINTNIIIAQTVLAF